MTLTAAEMRVLDLLPTHLSLAEIADKLHITRNTVKSEVAAVYRKLAAADPVRRRSRGTKPRPHRGVDLGAAGWSTNQTSWTADLYRSSDAIDATYLAITDAGRMAVR